MDASVLSGDPAAAPAGISPAEWRVRCDLAACFQLVDLYGMTDLASTHISARVPGPGDFFLVNPFGSFFEEVTASSLVKVDMDGEVMSPAGAKVNRAGYLIHSAVHMARPEIACALHTHTVAINAVAMHKDGLLPISNKALTMMYGVRYHDYEGPVTHLEERARLARNLGDGHSLIMRHHGALTVGHTVAEAFVWMHKLESACQYQVAGLSDGRELLKISGDVVNFSIKRGAEIHAHGGRVAAGGTEWPALLRKLERERGPSYRS